MTNAKNRPFKARTTEEILNAVAEADLALTRQYAVLANTEAKAARYRLNIKNNEILKRALEDEMRVRARTNV